MDKLQKKAAREEYDRRHPEKGIVCWQSNGRKWIATSQDATADFNATSFQLRMGSWPNREMQEAYSEDPSSFQWSILKSLDYKETDKNYSEELEILYMMCLDEYPEAEQMRPGRK